MALDMTHLRGWIGRTEEADEILTPTKAQQFAATLSQDPAAIAQAAQGPAPALIHFCLTQPMAVQGGLGRDGHPARGGFLPPVPLPRRMWAGGEIGFHGDLEVGQTVTRRSTIRDVVEKTGRSGSLCFVTVDHEILADGRRVLGERQDIVYRDDPGPPDAGAKPAPEPEPAPVGRWTRPFAPGPVMLFRYSALTFNGHRIHYDRSYATGTEGYQGLVVHGPLQATLLCHYAEALWGRRPKTFRFRGLSPMCDTDVAQLNADDHEGGLKLWTSVPGGPVSMEGYATW